MHISTAVLHANYEAGRILVRMQDEQLILSSAADAEFQIVNSLGHRLVTHLSERDEVISMDIAQNGFWEFAETLALTYCLKPGDHVLDVGANIGYYSTLFARLVGPSGRVVAFEPDEKNFQLLSLNAALMKQVHGWSFDCVNKAVTATTGESELYTYHGNLGFHSLYFRDHPAGSSRVETTTIDQQLSEMGIAATSVSLLKSDIQGGEYDMVRGAQTLLQTGHATLCLEFEPHISGAEKAIHLITRLTSLGYSRFRFFYANSTAPLDIAQRCTNDISPKALIEMAKTGTVAPYGTILCHK